jgi:2,3-dihydroxybenzoate-AMP ligase
MTIPFTRWPEEFARRYREKGYWQDLPLTHILTRHAESDAVAIIDGERTLATAFNQAVDNLASRFRRRAEARRNRAGAAGQRRRVLHHLLRAAANRRRAGERAVQPSAQRAERLRAQIKPAVLIADREHALFAGDDFLNAFVDEHARCASCCCAAIRRARPGRGDCAPGG